MQLSDKDLTLYNIETSMLQLFQWRDSLMNEPQDMTPKELEDSLKAVDIAIDQFIETELEKADAIARNIGEFELRAETCRALAAREAARAEMWLERAERLRAATLRALQLRPKDKQRIETAHTTLKIAKNPPSVSVDKHEDVPKPYMRRELKITADLYDRLMAHLMTSDKSAILFSELMQADVSDGEPMKKIILKELKAGVSVAGCRLVSDKVHLVVGEP